MKKSDIILIGVIVLVALAGLLIFSFRGSGREVVVYRDGTEVYRFELDSSEKIVLEGKDGQENELVIEDGKAYISYATCPDKICVKQGKITKEGETIVCLPHKIVVAIE